MVTSFAYRLTRVHSLRRAAGAAAPLVLSLMVAREIAGGAHERLAIAAAAAMLAAGLAFVARESTLFPLLVWLVLLGTTRRLVSFAGIDGSPDPLILVGPASLVAVLAAVRSPRLQPPTALSRGVTALLVLALLGAVNPLQGSLASGFAGALLVVPPLLSFWIGRRLSRETFLRVLRLAVALAVPAAVYGLYQTLVALPRWDARWLAANAAQYRAVNVNGVIRSFSSFSSAAEYGAFCSIAVVVLLALGSRSRWTPAVLGLLVAAVAYEATRTFLVGLVGASALMWTARRGRSAARALVTVAAVVAVSSLLAAVLVPHLPANGAGSLVRHQMAGLAHPFDKHTSTLSTHLGLIGRGVQAAFKDPLGSGSGAANLAGAKFGSGAFVTEADPSNAAVAWGLPGLLAYIVVAIAGLRLAYLRARVGRDPLDIAVLGILVVTFLQWLNGGYYAVSLLPWLALGWLDRDGAETS